MADPAQEPVAPEGLVEPSAGRLLRQARSAKSWDTDTLAARLKVSREKIEWLEEDRWDLLGNPVFVRALASSVCRLLEIDSGAVLARLPAAGGSPLEGIDEGLKAPFKGQLANKLPAGLGSRSRLFVGSSAAWRTALGLLLGALAVGLAVRFWPSGWLEDASQAVRPAASVAMPIPASAASASGATPAALPASSPLPSAAVGGDVAVVSSSEPSWLEVQDGSGQIVFSRVVSPGESVRLEGTLPLRVTVGNAQATRLAFRGQWIDLASLSRDNVAKVELK